MFFPANIQASKAVGLGVIGSQLDLIGRGEQLPTDLRNGE